MAVLNQVVDGVDSEGDAGRHGACAVPLCLQPLQGWLTFGGNFGGGARLATGYFLTARQAEAVSRPHDIGGWPRCYTTPLLYLRCYTTA